MKKKTIVRVLTLAAIVCERVCTGLEYRRFTDTETTSKNKSGYFIITHNKRPFSDDR